MLRRSHDNPTVTQRVSNTKNWLFRFSRSNHKTESNESNGDFAQTLKHLAALPVRQRMSKGKPCELFEAQATLAQYAK
jgi:hypothetical protein